MQIIRFDADVLPQVFMVYHICIASAPHFNLVHSIVSLGDHRLHRTCSAPDLRANQNNGSRGAPQPKEEQSAGGKCTSAPIHDIVSSMSQTARPRQHSLLHSTLQ